MNHNIMSHWALLNASELGNKATAECVVELQHYVTSLSQIDNDGQESSYSENHDGKKSLADRSLVNI